MHIINIYSGPPTALLDIVCKVSVVSVLTSVLFVQVWWPVHSHAYFYEVEGKELCQCGRGLWFDNCRVLLHLHITPDRQY